MTKFERLSLERKRASGLFDQGRTAEGRLAFEKITNELLKPLAPKKGK